MNDFLGFLRKLFSLSDEELEKVSAEIEKGTNEDEKAKEMGKEQKPEKKAEETKEKKDIAEGVRIQQAASNTDKGDEDMGVSVEEYKKLQEELAAVKGILEKNNADALAEKRMNKIKSYKDCLDTSYLSTLLDGVDEKDFDSKVEEIKKEKAYLFSKPETDGFNPAEPNNKLSGVDAAFYKQNTDLTPQF